MNEIRQRNTAANGAPVIAASEGTTSSMNGCACGPDGLLSCVEQGAHSALIDDANKP